MNDEIKNLLVQVISSWQVIVVTIALILYFSLVSYVAQPHWNRPDLSEGVKPKPKPKTKKEQKVSPDESEEENEKTAAAEA